MARIEQHGSDTYILKDVPEDGMVDYYQLKTLVEEAIRVGAFDLRDIAEDQLNRIIEEMEIQAVA
ncbi:MAG: hypothetical protein OIF32_05965 [Campylobacterales bacterium]|nr:hypothetical protein [Campylobacterales bacterium]